jgi:predicted alpha/beta-hydrolase family hydrolase
VSDVTTFRVTVADGDEVSGRWYAAERREASTLVLGHGAGAGQAHPWMVARARSLCAKGIRVATFNFSYTEHGRRVPDSPARLEATFASVLRYASQQHRGRLFAGGKSMGGRIATQVAASNAEVRALLSGLVLLGYPLHPPGRPAQPRSAHLPEVGVPMLFVQGSRDTFGGADELEKELDRLGIVATLHRVGDGDHSFKVPRSRSQDEVFAEVDRVVADWILAARR